jgi:hypothetical protein
VSSFLNFTKNWNSQETGQACMNWANVKKSTYLEEFRICISFDE